MTVEDILVCPKCKMPLAQAGGSFVCGQRHTYDISKHGYVNLVNTSSQKESGDSKEMSRARTNFLSGGAYGQFRDALCRAAGKGELLVDAGCGEGYYTCAAAEGFSLTVGFDLSKASVDYAARRAKTCGLESKVKFAVSSVYEMPIKSESADCILSIFAPCATEEFMRVLKPGGRLVVGCAGKRHLEGLKAALYENVRENTDRRDLPDCMAEIGRQELSYEITLEGRENIKALYMMTPYSHKTSPEAEAKLFETEVLRTLVDFEIRIYEKQR